MTGCVAETHFDHRLGSSQLMQLFSTTFCSECQHTRLSGSHEHSQGERPDARLLAPPGPVAVAWMVAVEHWASEVLPGYLLLAGLYVPRVLLLTTTIETHIMTLSGRKNCSHQSPNYNQTLDHEANVLMTLRTKPGSPRASSTPSRRKMKRKITKKNRLY